MKISTARHRLRFKRTFTTAHGTRDGTDAVFVRVEHQGHVGYGEATLPPYLVETAAGVESLIQDIRLDGGVDEHGSNELLDEIERKTVDAPAARNALTMAVLDLCARQAGRPLWAFLGLNQPPGQARAMVTLACADLTEIPGRLAELPDSSVLKVKLGTPQDLELLKRVKQLDARQLLLDANQGLKSLDEALAIVELAGSRALAIEQPFAREELQLHGALQQRVDIPVIGDESVQDNADLDRAIGVFGGVNIKLMKCGGIRQAIALVEKASRNGMAVMLGSMSESTLGCLAMLHLAGHAQLLDLDGPWLVGNDPFGGMVMRDGKLQSPLETGVGAGLDLPGLFPLSAHN